MMKMDGATTIQGYIANFPKETQKHLNEVYSTIKEIMPQAEEAIKYGMPTFVLNGNLIHFAGYDHHVGLYPTPTGVEAFKKDLSRYKQGKGSVQFPLDQPMPLKLIARIAKYRLKENLAKGKKKK